MRLEGMEHDWTVYANSYGNRWVYVLVAFLRGSIAN